MGLKVAQKGNALFLILIAVVLFAALSYAITQSGRGGGNTSKETEQIAIAEFLNHLALMRSHIERIYIFGDIDQVRFNESTETSSGTVYEPDGSSSTGITVGLFSTADGGLNKMYPPLGIKDPSSSDSVLRYIYFYNTRIQTNGDDVGTSAGDEVFFIQYLSQSACEKINLKLTGSSTIPTMSLTAGSADRDYDTLNRTGVITTGNSNVEILDVFNLPGCSVYSGVYQYFELVRAN